MIERIDHINIVVNDLEGMIQFYQKCLGFQISKKVVISGDWIDGVVGLTGVEADVVYLELPEGPRIELIKYHSPVGLRVEATGIPNTTGIRHIAFRVTAIDPWVERLSKEAVSFFGKVYQVPANQVKYAGGLRKRLVYFHDPEGNILELCEYS
ncbi:MAG: VOC family protein [Waddliaceae bacterium]